MPGLADYLLPLVLIATLVVALLFFAAFGDDHEDHEHDDLDA